MIREVCACGAEFETDDRDAVDLVKNWRRTHKHADKHPTPETKDSVVLSNTDIALGFQAIYDPLEEE
jgi:uncharacterized protein YprB with RNaseH-like and TPR domain